MILLSVALVNDGEAIIQPAMIEFIRHPIKGEEPAGSVIQFGSGAMLRARDAPFQLLNQILDAGGKDR